MALCTVDYIRSKISTRQSDEIIYNIITETTEDILAQCETTDETNLNVILAGKYATLAAMLKYMKTTGEMAASVSTGNSQRQNTTDVDIARYEQKSESYIEKYRSANSYSFSSPSFHEGFTSHHCGGHHGYH